MFMPYLTAVVNSMAYWPNPPSPEIEITFRPPNSSKSWVAAQAPIAAGKANPIDPK